MIIIPPIVWKIGLLRTSACPITPITAPKSKKIIENPIAKKNVFISNFLRASFLSNFLYFSDNDTPVIYPKNDGITGRMHGEAMESTPAKKAIMIPGEYMFIV